MGPPPTVCVSGWEGRHPLILQKCWAKTTPSTVLPHSTCSGQKQEDHVVMQAEQAGREGTCLSPSRSGFGVGLV